ncbi:hypothetical protein ACVJGD_008227 [Bradyrhizobium sp. USDA 10063]
MRSLDEKVIGYFKARAAPELQALVEPLRRFCAWLRNTRRRPLAGRFLGEEELNTDLQAYAREQPNERDLVGFAIIQLGALAGMRTGNPAAPFDIDEALISQFQDEAEATFGRRHSYGRRLADALRGLSAWLGNTGNLPMAGRFRALDVDCEAYRNGTRGGQSVAPRYAGFVRPALTHLQGLGEGQPVTHRAVARVGFAEDTRLVESFAKKLHDLVTRHAELLFNFIQWLHQMDKAPMDGRVHDETLDRDTDEYARIEPDIIHAVKGLRRAFPSREEAAPSAGAGAPPLVQTGEIVPPRRTLSLFPEAPSSARAEPYPTYGAPAAPIEYGGALSQGAPPAVQMGEIVPPRRTLSLFPEAPSSARAEPDAFSGRLAAPTRYSGAPAHNLGLSLSDYSSEPRMSAPDLSPWLPLGFEHSVQPVPVSVRDALARDGSLPGSSQPARVYAHGRPYAPEWQVTRREVTPTNPLGASIVLTHPVATEPYWSASTRVAASLSSAQGASSSARARPSSGPSPYPERGYEARPPSAGPGEEELPDFGNVVGNIWTHSDWTVGNKEVPSRLEDALRERKRLPSARGQEITIFQIHSHLYTAELRNDRFYLTHHPSD